MTNVYFNLIQREEMARNLWCKRSNTTGNSVSVDSSTDGGTTLAEYPGNHPVITQLSPRNHPLWDAIWKHVAMIFAVLVLSVANIGMAWGDTELFSTDFTKWTTQTPTAGSTVNGVWFKSNSTITNGTGWVFSGNASTSSKFIAIPLSGVNGEITVTITFPACRPQWNVSFKESDSPITISGNAPSMSSEPSSRPTGSNISTYSFTHTISKSYAAIYIGKGSNGASSLKSITITTPAGGGGSTYSITYHCNDATSGCPATNPATEQTALPSPLPTVTKTNYTFGGWYTDAAYSSAASAGASLSDDADLYAKWTQTITLDREGASTGSTSVTATYNSATLPSITNPTKDGFVFEGWYDGDNGTGNLVINTSGALQANVSGYTGADGIWTSATARTLYAKWTEKTCPSSGTLYTAAVKSSVSSNQSFPASATTEVSPSTQADITGGQLFAINGESSAKEMIKSSDGYKFCMTNNSTKFKLVLECELQAGDIITIDGVGGTKNDNPIGLWVSSSDSRPSSAPACSGTSTTTSLVDDLVNYTVTSSDEYHGKSILYIHRAVGSSTYFNNINISRPAAPSCSAPSSVGITGTSSYLPGQNISLTAAATGGSGTPTTYQWYHRGVAIDGATSATYTKSKCTIDDAGNYTCKVTMGGSCSTTSPNFAVRVYSVKVWSNGGGSVIGNYPLTYQSSNNGRAVISTLSASTTYEFKVIDNVGGTSDSTIYYGNGGTIHHNTAIDPATWDFGSTTATNCKLVTGVETGDFTFDVDITHNGTGAGFYVTVNVAYPTKTIYLTPGVWNAEGAKFAIHYYDANGGTGWTDFLTSNDCGMSAEIPVWDGVKMIAGRFNSTKASTGNWDDKWNQTNDITVSSYNSVVITGWNESDYTYNSNFSTPTYTISYAKGGTTATGGAAISGSKAAETKTCGVDFTLPSSAVFTATGYTQTGWTTSDGGAQEYALGGTYITNEDKTFYPVWEVAAVLTALECNTLYKVEHMVPASITLTGEGQYGAGLSANTKFEVIGDPAEAGNAGGTPEMKNEAAEFASQSFTARMYLKGASNTTGSGTTFVPTSRAVKFIVGEAGTLDIYAHRVDRLYLKKAGDSGTTQLGTSTSGSGSKVSHSVTAGTYYIYATNNNTCIYGIQLNCCTTPAAPTAFSAGSITSTGATFSITDAGDAASYDIYYSTSSTAPNASTVATTTSTEKTKAVTGLTANTTYYAWVRSVCDADHKSAWVALSGSSFTTTSTPAELTAIEANVLYQAADMANITFTGSDQWFAGLSTNAKFKTYGDGSSTSAKGKTVSSTSITDDIDTKSFTSIAYIMTADNTSSTSDPTKGAIEFITPSTAGYLYLYFENTSSALTLKKKGTSTSTSLSGAKYKKVPVEANTHYFINGAGSNRGLYGIKFIADETAPTFVSSVPANGATGVATSGTIVLTFSEALGTVDASKFTLTGATKGTVTIDGSDATKVNIPYSGAENSSTVTLATAAAAVSDVAGNALAAALSNISFTTAAAAPAGDCITITNFATTNSSNTLNVYKGTISDANKYLGKTTSSNTVGKNSGADLLLKYKSSITIYNAPAAETNFTNITEIHFDVKANDNTKRSGFEVYVGATKVATISGGDGGNTVFNKDSYTTLDVTGLEQLTGYVRITSTSSSGAAGYDTYIDNIQICTSNLPACTTPVIPSLPDRNACPGDNVAAWDATQTASLETGETVTYSWKKKGSDVELATTASFDVSDDAKESEAGTYVVTVTVSADGKADAVASAEVELSVTAAVEEPSISSNKATVYAGNSVTLTATCGTAGVTWNWYLCANADGTGAGSSLGTSSSYTIASAPAAGTYYYKAVATGTCGSAEHVYTLTVTAASECQNYYWFIYADDATANGVINNRDGFFSNTTTGTGNTGTYTMTVDGTSMTGTKRLSTGAYKPKFTVPAGATATLYIYGKAASSDAGKHLVLKRTSDDEEVEVTSNTTVQGYTKENIEAGEWTLSCGSSNWCYSFFAVKVCSTSSCTDATPTIAAVNNTVCSGTKMRIDATGYETGATFKWQKLNTSTSSWDDVAGATLDSLVINPAAAANAGSYRFIATKGCARTSNTVTISVPSAPNFGSTVPSSVSVMQTEALMISIVEATDAVNYKWYKSSDDEWDAGDAEIGTSKNLTKADANEEIGSPSYYVFCRAMNSCDTTTSSPIAVNVIAYVEEDCAARGSESSAEFGFVNTDMSSGTYENKNVWYKNKNASYLTYSAPEGMFLKTAKVTIASSSSSNASYQWSTDGSSWTEVTINSLTTTLTEKVIDLSVKGSGRVTHFRIGRNLDGAGESSGTFYLHKACFEYTENCTATTITISPTSKTYTIGSGDSWTAPTITLGPAAVASETLRYNSSNEDIAIVEDDGTVNFQDRAGTVKITASYSGGEVSSTEYCASSGNYTVTVSCYGGAPKVVADGSVSMSGCNNSVTLNAKMQDGSTDFTGGSYQWFRNGIAIDDATGKSYRATQAGNYTVEYTSVGGCTSLSTNKAIVTSDTSEPEVERLTPFQYYHVDTIYHETSIMRYRHLFAVRNSGTKNGKTYEMKLKRNTSDPIDVTNSNAFVMEDDTILLDLNKLRGKYSKGDELVLTCSAIDCSGNVSSTYKNTLSIYVIDKDTATMALILSGTKGGTMEEYTAEELMKQIGTKTVKKKTVPDYSTTEPWPLYTRLQEHYFVTPVNGYAPFNKLNYEQYDIIFLTDFPKKSKNATAINNLADLVDYRPMFTFKTHMSGLSKWATKGFTEDPEVPKQSRLRLNIVCYAHPMFGELQTPSIKNQMLRDASDNTQLVYTLLTEGGYEKKDDVRKGIQGFDFSASDNFVTIGLIHMDATAADSVPTNAEVTWTPGSSDRTLVAAAERQNNPEARMVMFSLNAGAHSKLTETGQNVVLACLEYLLQDVMIKPMADCAYTFDNDEGRGNGKWSVATNWLQEELPGPYQAVKVIAPATVDYSNAKALEVRLIDDGKITIAKNGVLTVQSTIRRKDGSTAIPTEDGDLVIETAADGQGALIFNNDRGDSRATVNLYSLGRKDGDNYQFQYIAMPMGCVPVHPYFEGSDILTYAYTEAGGWERRGYYTDLYAFEGIGITTRRSTASSFVIQGALTSTESQSLDMTYENSIAADKGYNMFGNSWSAPIQISQLGVGNGSADIQKTVYIYVAGKDPDGGPTSSGDKTEVAGKWLAIPFDASDFAEWTGLKVIPAFQAFEIQANSATTFKLDYDKMVRGGTTDMNAYLRAPKRRTAEHEGIELMVLHLAGGKVNNDLFMFEGEQFSDEFDNGWEATFKEDEEIPTQLYSPTPVGKLAVAALPSLEGAKVNFTTNETGEYTFTFSGAGNAYYLNDIKEQKSALIKEGNAYVFALEEGDAPDRFYISHTPLGAPAIATGVDEVDSEALKVRKIIHNDQLYIIRGGQLYDATGKVVK